MRTRNQKILITILTSLSAFLIGYFMKGTTKDKVMVGVSLFVLGLIVSIHTTNSEPENITS